VFFAPTCPLVATTSQEPTSTELQFCLQLWNGKTGSRGATLYLDPNWLTDVEFSSDGKQISATGLRYSSEPPTRPAGPPLVERIPRCWDVESGTEVTRPDSFSACNPIAELSEAASPRSTVDGTYRRGIRRRIHGWAYAPSARKLAWREWKAERADIWVWDAHTDISRRLLRAEPIYGALSISPDGRQLVTSRWVKSTREQRPLLDDVLSRFGMKLPDWHGSETCVFDARDGSEVACLSDSAEQKFSPDGHSLAIMLRTGDVSIYDAPLRKPYGQRVAIGFGVGFLVFLFLNFVQSSAFRAARATAGAIWRMSLQSCFPAVKLAR
jgi:WD40 repeat protein